MGTFTDLHKSWEGVKKKIPEKDRKLATKTFSKGLGPLLDEFDGVAQRLAAVRTKEDWNPEKILLLSPKAVTLGEKAVEVALAYKAAAGKSGWKDAETVAQRIRLDLGKWLTIESQQWKPTKEYIDLWRRVTLELSLSAAGLADAKTADDLRKLLDAKTGAINQQRRDDSGLDATYDKLRQALTLNSVESAANDLKVVDDTVERLLKDPVTLASLATKARDEAARTTKHAQAAKALVAQIRDFAAKDEVKKHRTMKGRAEALLKDSLVALRTYNETVLKVAATLARLPPGL
jgi:hypothetical protein